MAEPDPTDPLPATDAAAALRDSLRAHLRAAHATLRGAIAGLDDAALLTVLAPDTNSLAVLVAHTLETERTLIHAALDEPHVRDRDAAFRIVSASAEELIAAIDAWDAELEAMLERVDAGTLGRPVSRWRTETGAWWLLQLLAHTREHTGHATLTRQLLTAPASASERLRPLRRVRQIREFTDDPVDPADLAAIADVARWSGSSRNEQPWRFITIADVGPIRRIAASGLPMTRALQSAMAAVAIVLPTEPEREVGRAYDDGRAAERILIGATMLGLGAGIAWVRRGDAPPVVRAELGIPEGWQVRTIVAIGYPTEAALRPKAAPGTARRPREEAVFEERWRG